MKEINFLFSKNVQFPNCYLLKSHATLIPKSKIERPFTQLIREVGDWWCYICVQRISIMTFTTFTFTTKVQIQFNLIRSIFNKKLLNFVQFNFPDKISRHCTVVRCHAAPPGFSLCSNLNRSSAKAREAGN